MRKKGKWVAGVVGCYVHHDQRTGALVEVNCETDILARAEELRVLAHDIAMQVVATSPSRLTAEEVPTAPAERDVPLLHQPFIKDPGVTIQDLVNELSVKFGEQVVVRRFARFQVDD